MFRRNKILEKKEHTLNNDPRDVICRNPIAYLRHAAFTEKPVFTNIKSLTG
jgi:hypothetical protein